MESWPPKATNYDIVVHQNPIRIEPVPLHRNYRIFRSCRPSQELKAVAHPGSRRGPVLPFSNLSYVRNQIAYQFRAQAARPIDSPDLTSASSLAWSVS